MMNSFDATMIAEGVDTPRDKEHYIEAWQHLIDTGLCWQLQGWFGRQAQEMIHQGFCIAAKE